MGRRRVAREKMGKRERWDHRMKLEGHENYSHPFTGKACLRK